jgi:hypothetical protein
MAWNDAWDEDWNWVTWGIRVRPDRYVSF